MNDRSFGVTLRSGANKRSTAQSALQYNADGSLTLAFAPNPPGGVPQSNWLPTPAGKKYDMTYRFYGPAPEVVSGHYYPTRAVGEEMMHLNFHKGLRHPLQ